MKLLILSKIFPNSRQPTLGTFVLDETIELAKLHEVRVVAPVPWFPPLKPLKKWYLFSQIPEQETINQLAVAHPRYFILPKVGRRFYGYSYIQGIKKTMARIWAEYPFDLIIAHYAYPYGYAATYFQRKYNRPLLLKVHGSDINVDLNYASRRSGALTALRRATRLVVVSQALREKVIQLGIPAEKLSVIYNGINQAAFRVMDQTECRHKLKLASDRRYLLFVGNLVPVKGISVLLEAFERLIRQQKNNLTLLILGSGDLRQQILNQIQQKGLTQQVQLLGAQSHEQIPLWMNACDVLCLSSFHEGYPTVLIEAQACGLPIVATNVGGVSEIIKNGDLERIVPPGNALTFSRALSDLLNLVEKNSLIRASRYQRSWQDVVSDMNQLFLDLQRD